MTDKSVKAKKPMLLPRFEGLSDISGRNRTTANKSQRLLNKMKVYIELMGLGLSQASLLKLDPYAINQVNKFAGEFQKTSVKATALGWFKDSLKGELIANIAYTLYLRIAPHNKNVVKEPDPKDVLAAYKAFVLMYPFYLHDVDSVRGLELNRFFGLLDAIKEHKTAPGKCGKCTTEFIREASRRIATCPQCALEGRNKQKNESVV